MINSKKKGFTIVELVIVIAVVAVLAAVLIPTFSSLVKKANLSADQQAVRQINTLLATEFATEKPETLKEVVDMLDENGYDVDALEPLTEGYKFAWDKENNQIVFLTEAEASSYETLDSGSSYINKEVSTSKEIIDALKNGSDVTLAKDLKVDDEVVSIYGNTTIDLNNYDLDATSSSSRPFNLLDGAVLTINAEGSTINCGLYGLINIAEGADATIIINGGTYLADTKDGCFIKIRKNSKANITLNNVNYTDTGSRSVSDCAFIMDATLNNSESSLTINGGSFKGSYGFVVPNMNVTIKNANIITNSIALETGSGANVTIENCVIETLKENSEYVSAVHSSGGGKLTINGCTFKGKAEYAYGVLPTGGTLVASNNKIEVANEYYVYPLYEGKTASVTINGVTK